MSKKDINKSAYSYGTRLKLDIFRKCFREWFPVFVHNKSIHKIYIYDLFAGSGKDTQGIYGSPLILLEEAKGDKRQHCTNLQKRDNQVVTFAFNEKLQDKLEELKNNVNQFFLKCQSECEMQTCVLRNSVHYQAKPFSEIAENENFNSILHDCHSGKFILLDQYGFKEITDEVFLKLVNSPSTDFIFFISSSFVKRFKDLKAVTAYINTNKIHFDESQPKECHRVIAEYFKSLIPLDKEYYVHNFTIQKGTNYYGLIFGTSHSLGMEKFIKVCWGEDPLAGESNCNINNDFEFGNIFYNPSLSNKKQTIKQEIECLVLNGRIKDNVSGLKWTLAHGCEPKLFVEVIGDLVKLNKIQIEGKFNRQATNIHKVDEYKIIKV